MSLLLKGTIFNFLSKPDDFKRMIHKWSCLQNALLELQEIDMVIENILLYIKILNKNPDKNSNLAAITIIATILYNFKNGYSELYETKLKEYLPSDILLQLEEDEFFYKNFLCNEDTKIRCEYLEYKKSSDEE